MRTALRSLAGGPAAKRPGELEEYRLLFKARLDHLVDVREPLVLVSQIQRSGGTLLSQLFDGHRECHAHPHELTIGFPKSQHWPPLRLDRPGEWFDMLYEKYTQKHFRLGYQKPAERSRDLAREVFPFLFPPRLQKAIFDACVAARAIERGRDVLDCYFTSYFNAWLDNQNLYAQPKKVVTAFAPRLIMKRASVERFFADYPDGFLISMVRDARSWYASAHRQASYTLEEGLRRWRLSTEATLEAHRQFGERVLVLTYEQLALETEATMTGIAKRIGISMSPMLLTPTFNGRPIRANSSDRVDRYGVLPERASAYRESLGGETIARIEAEAGDLYERAAAAAFDG